MIRYLFIKMDIYFQVIPKRFSSLVMTFWYYLKINLISVYLAYQSGIVHAVHESNPLEALYTVATFLLTV